MGILKFIIKFGIPAAIKKYTYAAVMRVAKNHGLIKDTAKKTIPKKVGLTAKQEAERTLIIEKKKAAEALVKWRIKQGLDKASTSTSSKGPVTGSVVRNFRGKPEPTYSTGKKYKPYVPPKKP